MGLVIALIVLVWTRRSGAGGGSKSLLGFVIGMIGFGAGQQAINTLFNSNSQAADHRPDISPGGFITFKLDESSFIGHVGVTSDGQTVFTTTAAGAIRVWDTKTGKERWRLDGREIGAAVFSPRGQLLAVTARADKQLLRTVQIFSTARGELLATLQGAPANAGVDDMVFSHDGTYLLVGSKMLEVALYALGNMDADAAQASSPEPRVLDPISVPREVKLTNYWPHHFPRVGFNADDQSIFVLGDDRSLLERWSVEARPRLLSSIHFAETTHLSPTGIANDGQLAFECDLRSLRLAPADATSTSDVLHIKVPVELPPGTYHPRVHCDVSPDREWIVAGAREGNGRTRFIYTLNLWKTDGTFVMSDADPEPEPSAAAQAPQIGNLAFTPDSNYLYAADDHMQLRVYALRPSVKVAVIPAAEMGFSGQSDSSPLLAVSDHGVVLSYHGASKAVWVPSLTPP